MNLIRNLSQQITGILKLFRNNGSWWNETSILYRQGRQCKVEDGLLKITAKEDMKESYIHLPE